MKPIINNVRIIILSFILLIFNSCIFLITDDSDDTSSDDTFVDSRDERTYKTVTIGDQTWMAENLAFLPETTKAPSFSNKDVEAYFVYNGSLLSPEEAKATKNYQEYGVLYNCAAAENACPSGWHLPAKEEWATLASNISGENSDLKDDYGNWLNIGILLKSTTGWLLDGNGTDNYNFNALPGGSASGNLSAEYNNLGSYGNWWSSTKVPDSEMCYSYMLTSNYSKLFVIKSSVRKGYSIRCIKD